MNTFQNENILWESTFNGFTDIYHRLDDLGCPNGQKIVLKPASGVRKQFMFLNSKASIGFVTKGTKFSSCASFVDITSTVRNLKL